MMLLAVLLLAALPANSVPVGSGATTLCSEANQCVITAVSSPTAAIYFGTGTTWCATPVNLTPLPVHVSYTSVNPALCATDPAPGVAKSIVAVQQAAAYTITYTLLNRALQCRRLQVPAKKLPPPPARVLKPVRVR